MGIPITLKYRLAIFDSDGTLADTLPWMRSVFNDLAEEHGFRRVEPHDYERFRDLHGNAWLGRGGSCPIGNPVVGSHHA